MLSYYKPYRKVFWADMFFAALSAAVTLTIPLVVRYVTSTLIYMDPEEILYRIKWIASAFIVLVIIDIYF
jgi:ATP-binding cassette subfamily B protein